MQWWTGNSARGGFDANIAGSFVINIRDGVFQSRAKYCGVMREQQSLLSGKRSKTLPVTFRGNRQVCETSRLPHFLENRLTDGGKVVSLKQGPSFTVRQIFGTCFCQNLSRSQEHNAAGRITATEKFCELIGNLTRGLPACSMYLDKLRYSFPAFII
jgi:hypothetical protein